MLLEYANMRDTPNFSSHLLLPLTTEMANSGSGVLQQPPFFSIETERLYLRTLQISDAEKLLPTISKEEVMQWTTHRPVTSLAQAERWVSDRCLGPDVFNFGIEVRLSGEFIGVIGSFHWPYVGYVIDPGIHNLIPSPMQTESIVTGR